MNQTVRLILVFIAAAVGALLAPDVFHVLPFWAQVTAGALAAGLAGVGIVPPQYMVIGTRDPSARGDGDVIPTHIKGSGDQIGKPQQR
jgi:hypothetical protein